MDFKEIWKKYWFSFVIGAILIVGLFYFAADSMKDRVKKVVNDKGQDVVFTYDGQDYTADDLYDEVYDVLDIGVILPIFELDIYRDAAEVTSAMESDAKTEASQIILSLKTTYGENWEEALNTLLIQSGYVAKKGEKGLVDYLTIMEIRESIEREYVMSHPKLYEEYFAAKKPRKISHILVKMEDVENPTEAENKKLEEVKAALAKEGAVFSDVAQEFSDDGSKDQGGSLGIVDVESITQFVPEFKDQVYTVGYNETTEWFKTDYGYHIIKVDATTVEEFVEISDFTIFTKIFEQNPKAQLEITWDQVEKQGITFGDDEQLNKAIKEHYLGKEED